MKTVDPRSGGHVIDTSLVGTAEIIKFPSPHTPFGWIRSCTECGKHFTAPYLTGTIRDGSENQCDHCWRISRYGK